MALGYKAGRGGLRVRVGAPTNAVWTSANSGTVTYTLNTHGLANGMVVTVTGLAPSGYNATGTVSGKTANDFKLTGVTNPGTATVTGAVWSSTASGTVTYTTSAAHGFAAGDKITVTGITKTGTGDPNVTAATIAAAPTDTTFTVTGVVGVTFTYTSGGSVQRLLKSATGAEAILVAAVDDVVTPYVTSYTVLPQLVQAGVLKPYSTDDSDLTPLARLGVPGVPTNENFITTMMYKERP